MPDSREIAKNKLIETIQKKLKAESQAVSDFAGEFYVRGAAEDLVAYSEDELIGFAKHAFADFQTHPRGTHRVSVANPAFKATGKKAADLTVVEIVNDNMPFLVDSVMAELQDSRLEVSLVLHPIFDVERNPDGTLVAATGKKKGAPREAVAVAKES